MEKGGGGGGAWRRRRKRRRQGREGEGAGRTGRGVKRAIGPPVARTCMAVSCNDERNERVVAFESSLKYLA